MINLRGDALVLHRADTGVESVSYAGSVTHMVTRKVITAPSLIGEDRTRPAAGVVVSTAIVAGAFVRQHSEGVVVSTAITAGGLTGNHSEGVVVSTAITAGGFTSNHSEMLVPITRLADHGCHAALLGARQRGGVYGRADTIRHPASRGSSHGRRAEPVHGT